MSTATMTTPPATLPASTDGAEGLQERRPESSGIRERRDGDGEIRR
ncbi:MAG TPA: hypothetical protein VFY39_15475 [Gammaproteobacteria bacterium]|nr:hypothetical protein [Gammaproteobacteria bacterium]